MADTIQYFVDHNIPFDPAMIFEDVIKAKDYVHGSGILHTTIMGFLEQYLDRHPDLGKLLFKLRSWGKKVNLFRDSIGN